MAATSKAPPPSFDKGGVEALLDAWYEREMNSALRRPSPREEARKRGGTVFDIQPEMSSSKAVPVLLDLGKLLGFEPSKKVIKKGGYHSKEEFVRELSSQIEEEFVKHYGSFATGPSASHRKEASTHARI